MVDWFVLVLCMVPTVRMGSSMLSVALPIVIRSVSRTVLVVAMEPWYGTFRCQQYAVGPSMVFVAPLACEAIFASSKRFAFPFLRLEVVRVNIFAFAFAGWLVLRPTLLSLNGSSSSRMKPGPNDESCSRSAMHKAFRVLVKKSPFIRTLNNVDRKKVSVSHSLAKRMSTRCTSYFFANFTYTFGFDANSSSMYFRVSATSWSNWRCVKPSLVSQ